MKVTLAITGVVCLLTGFAFAQNAQDADRNSVKAIKTIGIHAPPVAPIVPESTAIPERIVITHGAGGSIYEHNVRFMVYRNAGAMIEMRGPCYSACTLITAYVGKDKLCIAEGAFFAFHAARYANAKLAPAETAMMYWQQPEQIRAWIDRQGGHAKLPLDGFWTMYDRDLWSFGYPRCRG